MKKISKYKLEKLSKKQLVSLYEKDPGFKNCPNRIHLLMPSLAADPYDNSIYHPMPAYETMEHLPFGDDYKIGLIVDFDGFSIAMTQRFIEEVEEGVIYFYRHLIRVGSLEDFEGRYLLNGYCAQINHPISKTFVED